MKPVRHAAAAMVFAALSVGGVLAAEAACACCEKMKAGETMECCDKMKAQTPSGPQQPQGDQPHRH